MTEGVKNWILAIASCAVVLSVFDLLVPKGAMKKVSAFVGGLVMLLVMLGPLTKMNFFSLSDFISSLRTEQEDYAQSLLEGNQSLLEKLIAEESQAYILEWAEELGFSCEVTVLCRSTESGLPFPSEAVVTSSAGEAQLSALSERIERELGIAKEHQIYREEK